MYDQKSIPSVPDPGSQIRDLESGIWEAAINIQTATRAFDVLKTIFLKPGGAENFSNDRSQRCEFFCQIFVQIGPILAIFRPFEIFRIFHFASNFAFFARFLKSYTGFDVKISFPSVFGFRCTYYEPRATENRPIDGRGTAKVARAGGGGWPASASALASGVGWLGG